MLIVDGKPANSEDLVVLWTLGLPYKGQHGDDEKRWLDAFGALPDEPGIGYENPPPASQPEHEWALGVADAAIAQAVARGTRIAVAVVDSRGEAIQQDTMDGAPSAAPFVAKAVAAAAAMFQRPSGEIDSRLTSMLPIRVLTVAVACHSATATGGSGPRDRRPDRGLRADRGDGRGALNRAGAVTGAGAQHGS